MKKFTLLVASLFVAIGAMAQETIRLTFERTGTTASTVAVSVVDENGDAVANATATVTEESAYGFKGTAGNITSAILCPAVNATANPTITLAFTINGVTGFSFNNVGLHIHGLNGGNNYQSNSDNKTRQWNVAATVGGNTFGSLSNIDIAAGIDGVNKMWDIAGATTNIDGETVVKLTITKGTTNEGCFFGLSEVKLSTAAVETDNTEAVAALDAAIANAEAMSAYVGEGVGKYTYTGEDNYEEAFAAIVAYREAIESTNTPTPAEVEAETEKLNNLVASFELNMPEAGKYYTIKNGDNYITSAVTSGGNIACSTTNDANAIYYYDGSHLLAYSTGRYIGLDSSDWAFETVNSTDISAITFIAAVNGAVAKYNVKSADRWMHISVSNDVYYINRCRDNTCGDAHNWTIEEVETLPVTVTEAGYATLYAPVALTVPAGVTAHTVTLNGEWATLSEALEVIPANTGVVLAGTGSHSFEITTSDAFNGTNALSGTVAATNISDDAYVLAMPEGAEVAGFYIATKNQEENTKWLNNSHKAYLPATTGASSVACYSFRFGEGTTGVEKVEMRNENGEIFDLTGRKVNSIAAPGIYIVNGKKVLVK